MGQDVIPGSVKNHFPEELAGKHQKEIDNSSGFTPEQRQQLHQNSGQPMVTTATQPQRPMGVKPPVWGHGDPCVHPPDWGHCMEAATSQKGIRSRNRDASSAITTTLRRALKMSIFSFTPQKRLWNVHQSHQGSICLQRGEGPDKQALEKLEAGI